MDKPNIISYGGGTQSTAMVLMALNGYEDMLRPDFGVFADVGGEPQFILDYVDYFIDLVKREYDFDIYKVKKGDGLEKHLLTPPKKSRNGHWFTLSVPPFYLCKEDGSVGMLSRQCTNDFKIGPINSFITQKLGRAVPYNMWIGISFDERSRMKLSRIKKRTNVYPLVERFIRRADSIKYVKEMGLRSPMRSSCVFCPYHSDEYWQWLKDYHQVEFQRACDFEHKIQNVFKTANKAYLHSSCKPLGQVQFVDENQLNMFPHMIDECDGECGI